MKGSGRDSGTGNCMSVQGDKHKERVGTGETSGQKVMGQSFLPA